MAEDLLSILDKFLLDTRARLAMAGVGTVISEASKHFLIQKGTNLRYGARPLRRAVREYLEYPLASLIAEVGIDRNQMVQIDAGDEKLEFRCGRMKGGGFLS